MKEIRKKQSILRAPDKQFLQRPSPKATRKIRDRGRELTHARQGGKDVKQIIAEPNPVLRGWGNDFRTGNAEREFNKLDRFVYWRMQRWQYRRGGQRATRQKAWSSDPLYGMGLHRLQGTVCYPTQATSIRSSLSCVRETARTVEKGLHGSGSAVTLEPRHNLPMSLMREIREFPVPRGSVGLWWLGQNGYIFKSHEGTLVSTDLYLTDSCVAVAPEGIDFSRQVPVLIPPEEIDVDLFVCTHNHQDHTDPETIGRLRNRDTTHFIGPHPSCDVFARQGVESGRIVPTWPDHVVELRDVVIRGAFALPTDDTDLNHMGFIFEFAHGPRIYMTGDTAECELLASARRHEPHLMITCINGGFQNLSHDQAARLASQVQPRAAIPCHYDMFADNAADPRQFRSALKLRAPDVQYLAPQHGQVLVYEA